MYLQISPASLHLLGQRREFFPGLDRTCVYDPGGFIKVSILGYLKSDRSYFLARALGGLHQSRYGNGIFSHFDNFTADLFSARVLILKIKKVPSETSGDGKTQYNQSDFGEVIYWDHL